MINNLYDTLEKCIYRIISDQDKIYNLRDKYYTQKKKIIH